MHARRFSLYIIAALIAIIAGLVIGYFTQNRRAPPLKTTALLLHPQKSLPTFSLTADNGQPFGNAEMGGHWSLLYFGYTHCPDVCPTTLTDLNQMLGQLKDIPPDAQPRVYFISVDPKRDTPALLGKYARYFNPAFIGVTGDVEQLQVLTRFLGVAFSYDPPEQSGNYSVEHSSIVFLINPRTEETAIYTPPMNAVQMADDYRTIVERDGDH